MFRIYFKVALRNIMRDRLHAVVNILGLSLGIAVAVIVFLYIQSELSYDRYHLNGGRLFRLTSNFVMSGELEKTAVSSHAIGPMMTEQNAGVEAFARLEYISESKLRSPYAESLESHLLAADSGFLSVFGYKVLHGDPMTCLSKPMSIVLSQSMANKYFGLTDPMGQQILSGSNKVYTVTGVVENVPENTHHYFDALISLNSLRMEDMGEENGQNLNLWGASVYTFLRLKEGYTPEMFYADFPTFWKRNMADVGASLHGYFYPILQPITQIHIAPPLDYDFFEAGNTSYIYGFATIGLFLLLLAAINYTNMATARSSMRTREVGLRKVLGSRRHHLMAQFLGESLLTSFLALLLALAMVELILELTPFNELMGKNLRLNLIGNPALGWSTLIITFFLGLISGAYPAFSLSSGSAGRAMSPRRWMPRRLISLRKGLVIFQFTVSIGVIISTFLMENQVEYMRNVDLGYNDDNTVVIPAADTNAVKVLPQLRAHLEALPDVVSTTTAHQVPGGGISRMVFRVEEEGQMQEEVVDFMKVGVDFVEGMGLKLVQGEDFSQSSDPTCDFQFIVNQNAANEFFDGDAIGKKVRYGLEMGKMQEHEGEIVGVVKDFNVHSLRYQMRPLIIQASAPGGLLYVRLDGKQMAESIERIRTVWAETAGEKAPFAHFFINEKFEKLYAADRRLSSLMGILAYLCVLISVMGLLGFASYTIELRKKEIGIRKVLGASLSQIVLMLFREIFFLIIFSTLLGSVLAFLVVQLWLDQFAYQAAIPIATFFWVGVFSMTLAFLTVSYHSVKAALFNPVHSLKYE